MRTSLALVLAALLALAGCGGGGGGAKRKAGGQEVTLAYENGYQQCTGYPNKKQAVTELATIFNADEKTPEAVGEAVARSNPGQPELHEPTKQGCLDAIDGKPMDFSGSFDPAEAENG